MDVASATRTGPPPRPKPATPSPMKPPPLPSRIEGDDLVIRRWTEDDAEAMTLLIAENLDHLRPWMAWARREPLSTPARLRLIEKWDRTWESGQGAIYAIESVSELVGGCALHRRVGLGGLDIGYWLGEQASGRGLATRTARALTEAAFQLEDTAFVQISHEASNARSAAVARRLGFTNLTSSDDSPVTTWRRRPRRHQQLLNLPTPTSQRRHNEATRAQRPAD